MRVDIAYHTVNGHTFWMNEQFADDADLETILDEKRGSLFGTEYIRVPNGDKIADVKVSSIDAVSVSKSGKRS